MSDTDGLRYISEKNVQEIHKLLDAIDESNGNTRRFTWLYERVEKIRKLLNEG